MASYTVLSSVITAGGLVSTTATEKPHCDLLPARSSALQETAVAPSGKALPAAGAQLEEASPESTSLAKGVKAAGVPRGPAHSKVREAGQVSAGGVRSMRTLAASGALVTPTRSRPVADSVVTPSRSGSTEAEAVPSAPLGTEPWP